MTTYYQDSSVRVTSEWIEVGRRRFRIAELTYVWHQRGRPNARTAYQLATRYGLVALLTVPVVVAAILLANLLVSDYGLIVVVGMAAVLATVGMTLLVVVLSPLVEFPLMALERSYDRGVEVREIWIQWRGRELLLLRTADAARFGRVYRAIERAVERHEA